MYYIIIKVMGGRIWTLNSSYELLSTINIFFFRYSINYLNFNRETNNTTYLKSYQIVLVNKSSMLSWRPNVTLLCIQIHVQCTMRVCVYMYIVHIHSSTHTHAIPIIVISSSSSSILITGGTCCCCTGTAAAGGACAWTGTLLLYSVLPRCGA